MRREDIPQLILHFIGRISEENNMKSKEISADAIQLLGDYHYPGNIRELRNLIERLMIITAGDQIDVKEVKRILPRTNESGANSSDSLLYSRLEDTERALILKTLEENHWHISKVAKILGLERSHLYKKMKRYGINRPD